MRQTHFHPRTGVIALARQKLADIETAAHLPPFYSSVLLATQGLLTAGVERRAALFADAAIWFDGALAALAQEHGDTPVDPSATMVSLLDATEVVVQDMRHRVLKQIGTLAMEQSGPRLSGALRALACSSADLYDALVRFKWAVIERDSREDDCDFFEWLGLDAPAAEAAPPSGLAGLRAAVPVLRQSWWQRKALALRP